ncbi:hypothetical protein [Streptomyces nanshensis]|uniref:Uncharacterized protein n=1 Tax=Streptomyces nanshensis TaxID=518642 RepID=A0A1E7KF68_9ACTN|nr:hypothetical protein [Streptomyces nanshensis]OEV02572.1 hypothetical protein AN218_33145 [Streptomyces nanshensis]
MDASDDPHIHVETKTAQGGAAVRGLTASVFGLAADAPAQVDSGCGRRVPYAMTSPLPEKVTCLACREHARAEHLRLAESVERLGGMPGSVVGPREARLAAGRHRGLAERFAGDGDG